jgi:DNA-binding NarL/FixJ family response regulator
MELRVFLVEDLQNMRTLLEELFSALGDARIVATARTEAEANLWLSEHAGAWDVTIVDLVLDEGSGMNVIRRARDVHPTGKIAVFSSYATPGVRQHCLGLGADAVFPKAETEEFIAWLHAAASVAPDSP